MSKAPEQSGELPERRVLGPHSPEPAEPVEGRVPTCQEGVLKPRLRTLSPSVGKELRSRVSQRPSAVKSFVRFSE